MTNELPSSGEAGLKVEKFLSRREENSIQRVDERKTSNFIAALSQRSIVYKPLACYDELRNDVDKDEFFHCFKLFVNAFFKFDAVTKRAENDKGLAWFNPLVEFYCHFAPQHHIHPQLFGKWFFDALENKSPDLESFETSRHNIKTTLEPDFRPYFYATEVEPVFQMANLFDAMTGTLSSANCRFVSYKGVWFKDATSRSVSLRTLPQAVKARYFRTGYSEFRRNNFATITAQVIVHMIFDQGDRNGEMEKPKMKKVKIEKQSNTSNRSQATVNSIALPSSSEAVVQKLPVPPLLPPPVAAATVVAPAPAPAPVRLSVRPATFMMHIAVQHTGQVYRVRINSRSTIQSVLAQLTKHPNDHQLATYERAILCGPLWSHGLTAVILIQYEKYE